MRISCASLRATLLAVLTLPAAFSQQSAVLTIETPKTVSAKPGATIDVPLDIAIDPAYHVNANAPADPYLIPLRLTWAPGALDSGAISYPQPKTQKFDFSATPFLVFSGRFRIVTKFTVAAGATSGLGVVSGKLRYQACNDHECLAPKTIAVDIPVDIAK